MLTFLSHSCIVTMTTSLKPDLESCTEEMYSCYQNNARSAHIYNKPAGCGQISSGDAIKASIVHLGILYAPLSI
jgi:hypothetical protein